MAKRYETINLEKKDGRLEATITPELEEGIPLVPSGQMLVDSEKLAFLYILDSGDNYHYLSFPQSLWKILKESIEQEIPVMLRKKDIELLELKNFNEELKYLIENIKGNPNYGEKMTNEVEQIFINMV